MEIHNRITLDAPADAAWQVLGEQFGAVGDWTSTLIASRLTGPLEVGTARVCTIEGFGPIPSGEVQERLHHFDPEARELSYHLTVGMPPFMSRAENRWKVTATGERSCVVTSEATLTFRWWARPFQGLFRRQIAERVAVFFAEAKQRIETGTLPAAKRAA